MDKTIVSSHTDSKSISARFRKQRMYFLDKFFHGMERQEVMLVDLGGTLSFWEMNLKHLECREHLVRIDVYNLEVKSEAQHSISGVEVIEKPGDVTRLGAITDNQYDLAFSNSVIEHVGNLQQQDLFAQEIRRVAPCFVLQTPNRNFPLEAHFYVPFFPFFPFVPLGIRTWLHRHFQLGWFAREPDELKARIDCDAIRLLNRREPKLLFPDSRIFEERIAGLVKSFIVTGKGGA